MKILIDTNVVLDILLHRQPWYADAGIIFGMTEERFIESYVPASAVTDIFYIAQKQLGKSTARQAIKRLFKVFLPASVTGNNIYQALDLNWADFEDSVQYIVGEGLSVDCIVTRNVHDFTSGSITTVTPGQFLQIFDALEK